MASVGNGHLATNLYSDTIFMNGLYNGELGKITFLSGILA